MRERFLKTPGKGDEYDEEKERKKEERRKERKDKDRRKARKEEEEDEEGEWQTVKTGVAIPSVSFFIRLVIVVYFSFDEDFENKLFYSHKKKAKIIYFICY